MASLRGGPVALVMFDLDGTLVDTVPDISMALNAALDDLDLPSVTEHETRSWVGNGARVLCSRAIARDMNDTAKPSLAEKLLERFLVHYAERICVETRVYAGVLDCLAALSLQGCMLACVTNKPEMHTCRLLDALDLDGYFDVVVGGDTLPRKKPDAAPLRHVMTVLNVNPAGALMVGDSATDIAAARAAGVRSVCVTYGYNRGHDVHELGADHVVETLRELPGLLETDSRYTRERQ